MERAVKERASIVACAARSPLGANAQQTALMFRTGAAAMSEAPLLAAGEPVNACVDPGLPPDLLGPERVAALALAALAPLANALETARGRHEASVAVVLCLDPHHAEGGLRGVVADRVARHAARAFPGSRFHLFGNGSGGGGQALALACDLLERGGASLVVFGGAHSDLDPAVFSRLVAEQRLMTASNLDAIIPGECAAFVALTGPRSASRIGMRALAGVVGLGTATEAARPDNDVPAALARGLTRAMHEASAPLRAAARQAGWLLSDASFETWRTLELQSVMVRAKDVFGGACHIDIPAQRLGALGAAAIPMFAVLATEAWQSGFAPDGLALALAGSDGGERAAVVLSRPG